MLTRLFWILLLCVIVTVEFTECMASGFLAPSKEKKSREKAGHHKIINFCKTHKALCNELLKLNGVKDKKPRKVASAKLGIKKKSSKTIRKAKRKFIKAKNFSAFKFV